MLCASQRLFYGVISSIRLFASTPRMKKHLALALSYEVRVDGESYSIILYETAMNGYFH